MILETITSLLNATGLHLIYSLGLYDFASFVSLKIVNGLREQPIEETAQIIWKIQHIII